MAKDLSRKVTIYVNDKEVKSSISSLEAEYKKIRILQKNMVIGSEEYIQASLKMKEIKNVLDKQKEALEELNQGWKTTLENVSNIGDIIMGVQSLFQMSDAGVGKVKDLVKAYAEMDDIYADVMKTTGLTHEQVESLNCCELLSRFFVYLHSKRRCREMCETVYFTKRYPINLWAISY